MINHRAELHFLLSSAATSYDQLKQDLNHVKQFLESEDEELYELSADLEKKINSLPLIDLIMLLEERHPPQ